MFLHTYKSVNNLYLYIVIITVISLTITIPVIYLHIEYFIRNRKSQLVIDYEKKTINYVDEKNNHVFFFMI